MPKTPSNAASTKSALRRNQACRTCRKRKLKCDAARPHCSTCVKQWQAAISVPAPVGYSHPAEPQCSYDPVEGLSLLTNASDPYAKIQALEEEVAQLKTRLYEQQLSGYTSSSPARERDSSVYPNGGSALPGAASSPATHSSPESTSNASALSITSRLPSLDTNHLVNASSPEDNLLTRPSTSRSPDTSVSSFGQSMNDPIMELLLSGWNSDLPDPQILTHYVETFFRCDPCGSRILHQPSLMQSLLLSPRDERFPHSALLHAICASASRWISQDAITLPDGTRRDTFAEFHASKVRSYVDKTMATGQDIFEVLQACNILCWYFYQESRWVEVWIFAGFQTRVAVPLRLNYPGTFSSHGHNSPGAYLAPPQDAHDLELRRRMWWMSIVFDRIASIGGWLHSIDERDLATELPLTRQDFYSGNPVPSSSQDLNSITHYTEHPARYTDSFILLIKAVMLFGKVTDYNVRGGLRAAAPPSTSQNPFCLDGFEPLDKLVSHDFLASLPPGYKTNQGVGTDNVLDTDLYMVHILPHGAIITLHNPYLNFFDPNNVSSNRCYNSAKAILNAYYMLSRVSLDTTRLHPLVVICWYLAAVVEVQLCKHYIETGNAQREQECWAEINELRTAMLTYGSRSPIGTRQERLLQGLMKEIVELTNQKRPMDVGIRLYPFSHTTLFEGREDPTQVNPAEEPVPQAPLPGIASFVVPEQSDIPPPPPPPAHIVMPTHNDTRLASEYQLHSTHPSEWGIGPDGHIMSLHHTQGIYPAS